MIRAALVQWAYTESITGRKDAVNNARKILLFLASVSQIKDRKPYQSWYTVKQISRAIDLGERAAYRAIQRLLEAGLIDRYSRPMGDRSGASVFRLKVRVLSIDDTKVVLKSVPNDSKPKEVDAKNDSTPTEVDSINNESKGSNAVKDGIVVVDSSGQLRLRRNKDEILPDDAPFSNDARSLEIWEAREGIVQNELFNFDIQQ